MSFVIRDHQSRPAVFGLLDSDLRIVFEQNFGGFGMSANSRAHQSRHAVFGLLDSDSAPLSSKTLAASECPLSAANIKAVSPLLLT